MKRLYTIGISILAVVALAGCNDTKEFADALETTVVLTATHEGISPETKTLRMADGSTWWNPTEEISVFYGSGSNGGSKFMSKNTTIAETTVFEGSLSMSGSKEFWAVYPYSEDNSCDGKSITTVIPSEQTGVEGNFSDDAFPAMGKTNSTSLSFLNICGGIRFSVSRDDIQSVSFFANNGEVLSGKVSVVLDEFGRPVVSKVLQGNSFVTLIAPNGGTFKPGVNYYITLLPIPLENGFSVSFSTSSLKGSYSSSKPQVIKRSMFGVVNNIDSYVSSWESAYPVPEAVDLGLSVKWASFNLGASKPEEYGNYYAWGETETKTSYENSNYKWSMGSWTTFTKYCSWPSQGYNGFVDYKSLLDSVDDAATMHLRGEWRMPEKDEQLELMNPNNCKWEWTSLNNVNGYLITSLKAGFEKNSIFLPAAGYPSSSYGVMNGGMYGYYWSSSGNIDNSPYDDAYGAFYICINSNNYTLNYQGRQGGCSIRPVYGKPSIIHPAIESVSLDRHSISLCVGDSDSLSVSITPSNAYDKSVTWKSSNDEVAVVVLDGVVFAVSPGETIITVSSKDGSIYDSCLVNVSGSVDHDAVDLGLSVKWAKTNIGASVPEGFGCYFAWGEILPKNRYAEDSYKWYDGDYYHVLKYNCVRSLGVVDNKTTLDIEDDAAHVYWGGNWRMPTMDEQTDLLKNCNIEYAELNGIKGCWLTSKVEGFENKSIFIPFAGYMNLKGHFDGILGSVGGSYWSSENTQTNSVVLYVDSRQKGITAASPYFGLPIRPVYGEFIPVSSITLDFSSFELTVGDSALLNATISPSNATAPSIRWESGDESIVSVDQDGNLSAFAEGTTTITAYASNGLRASCVVSVIKPEPEAVDLGLPSGLKWASCNVGATKPEKYGDFYAWGETEPKSDYSWSTYKWCNGVYNKLTKYCTVDYYWDSSSPMDYKTVLDSEDDAASVNWGGSWRMPTDEEWAELMENCIWTWTSNYNGTGIAGRMVTSKKNGYTDKSIFLPAAGYRSDYGHNEVGNYGGYWSSSLNTVSAYYAWCVYFYFISFYSHDDYRRLGLSVRPVCPKD